MKRIILIVFTLSIVWVSNLYSQHDPVIDKIIEIGKSDNQTMQHLDVLSNRIGGRLIGSDAYETATKWATKKFKEWGMEVIVDSVGSLPVGFNRGPWFGRMLDQNGIDRKSVV